MNIRALETFYWITRLGSFRATARKLYASQPSVSARISSLEDELGVELFDRTTPCGIPKPHFKTLARWQGLTQYTQNGHLPIDNNGPNMPSGRT